MGGADGKRSKSKRARGAKPKESMQVRLREAREATGRMDPAHAARLLGIARETQQKDADVGFVAKPRSNDALAEQLGELAVSAMTSGESDAVEETFVEEEGGPFVETSGAEEFADGTDASNIPGATREPFPRV
jgi:hypothetical protein